MPGRLNSRKPVLYLNKITYIKTAKSWRADSVCLNIYPSSDQALCSHDSMISTLHIYGLSGCWAPRACLPHAWGAVEPPPSSHPPGRGGISLKGLVAAARVLTVAGGVDTLPHPCLATRARVGKKGEKRAEMVLALLVYSFREDSCCLLPVVLWAPWETCHLQQGSSGLLGWEQASLRVPCHLGAVLRVRRSPEGAAGAGDTECAWCSPLLWCFPRGLCWGCRGGWLHGARGSGAPRSQRCPQCCARRGLAWLSISCCSCGAGCMERCCGSWCWGWSRASWYKSLHNPSSCSHGGAGEGAPAASCSTETAFGLGSLSSKLVDPHLRSSQNWFRKRRLQMYFINLNCDNSLTRALPCTPHGLSYMSREGSNIGLTRPAFPRTARCGISQPPAAAAPAILLSSLFPSAGKAAALLAGLRPQAAGPHRAPALVVFRRAKQLVPLPLHGAGWDSPPPGRCCELRIASVCPSLQGHCLPCLAP
ncbi:uncharacterized protein LOC115335846 isoform X4 [Aquila chrysaetos chrysaetos]|uniref:uncharacterized protein LOC115335846 isoform X4 n=1 Tax=Aquila chrysaetos chrysaetos TaxID=223781 RepID=UPI00117720B8|nr:uncharacterized protein LOC115335846 isoform X4 [Aquila chrysaetos chrysaetos]